MLPNGRFHLRRLRTPDALRPVEALVVNVSNEYESTHSFSQKAAISIFHNIRDGLRR
jgi:hypothetical protein